MMDGGSNLSARSRPEGTILKELLALGIPLLASCFSIWVGAQIFARVMYPQPDKGPYKRLLKRLGLTSKDLKLNDLELTLSSNVITPEELDVDMDDFAGQSNIIASLMGDVKLALCVGAGFTQSSFVAQRGILLYGPPGTGKTMIAKALAREYNAVLINVVASSLFSKWLGESNKITKAIFTLAAKLSAVGKYVIVFIDEVDAILGDSSDIDTDTAKQVRTEFLLSLQGIRTLQGATIVGATNQPQCLSDAIWRRFSEHFEIPLPGAKTRAEILKKKLKHMARERVRGFNLTTSLPGQWLDSSFTSTVPCVHSSSSSANGQTEGPPSVKAVATHLGVSEDLVVEKFKAPLNPLERIAALTDGFSGSDLYELCKRCARRGLLRAVSSAPMRARTSGPAIPVHYDENDLLHSLAETKAAANTVRVDYSRNKGSRWRASRATPTPPSSNGNGHYDATPRAEIGGIGLDFWSMLSCADPETLRSLATFLEQRRGGAGASNDPQ